MTGLADTALAYAAYGWHIFPLHNITSGRCTCGRTRDQGCSPGKHPRTLRGLHDATTDTDQVLAWWDRWPAANIGIRTGAISGLLVIDIDHDHGGFDSLAKLEAANDTLTTREAETGSGGSHLYFQHPGHDLGNSAGKLGPGIDTRGDGGYVVAPPSGHASGGTYRWCGSVKRINPPPDWLVTLLRPPPRRPPGPIQMPARRDGNRYWLVALEREAEAVMNAINGTRNATLNTAAFNLGQLVAGAGAPQDTVRSVLVDAGIAAGLPRLEAERTVDSGLGAGQQEPRMPA